MKKNLSFLVSRQTFAVVALVLAALVIWFLGPFVALDGMRPLAGIGMRFLMIVLLLAGVLLWLAELSTSVVFVALLCLLIWYVSPLLSFGHAQPFSSASVRIITVSIVLLAFAICWFIWLLKKMRADEQFVKRLLAFGMQKNPSIAAERITEVSAIVASTLDRLKNMRTGARAFGGLLQGKRYLYELPWFIAVGARASGKTSALLNAGLVFPIAEQMQQSVTALRTHTQSVDVWLTNDAVLIDTAGHYTRHGTSTRPIVPMPVAAPNKKTDATGDTTNPTASDPDADTAKADQIPSAATTSDKPEIDLELLRQDIDAAEWQGFLSLLRQHRPRAPINGALLVIDIAILIDQNGSERVSEAAALRGRLSELRRELGIRFPVYLVITKTDQLTGFTEYFDSLTAQDRVQPWGFTLPYGKETIAKEGIEAHCRKEIGQLVERIAHGIEVRLQEEYDEGKRKRLALLAYELTALADPLAGLIERVFLDSRYDDTQAHATLRGVYFTSAMQSGTNLVAEGGTVMAELPSHLKTPSSGYAFQTYANGSYFLHDLLANIVFPHAHLVHPNLRWELRFKLMRLLGHTLALLLFSWYVWSLYISFVDNRAYLNGVERKTQALGAMVAPLYKSPKSQAVPVTLADAYDLPTYSGLDLANPDSTYRYGLYAAPDIVTASHSAYDALADQLFLPQVVRRMEDVIAQSIANKDTKATYDALRVYLMLYDKTKFDAADVKAWVLDDWAHADSATVFGGRAAMVEHVERLFSGSRVVQSPLGRNDALIRQARTFLDASNATDRLYQRAKLAMQKDAPDEFTLVRAVGPQAGLVFTRASGAPLSRGIPGLFTFDGYRKLFDKRLPEFVKAARDDDAWVMGRSYLGSMRNAAQKKTSEIVNAATDSDDPVTDAIRREYLMEYAQQWDAFLGDIRTVTGTSLAFNLQILRSFAAPDSPLARLARAAVRETTLTRTPSNANDPFLERATDPLRQKTDATLGIRASEGVERELVDSHFAALREVVTGSADSSGSATAATDQTGKTGLDGITNLLNDYYTALTVADNALTNNSMPPSNDAAAKLKMTADTMPAPFHEVLLALAADGSREENQGIGQLLSRQMQAVVGDTCRLTIEGNYPFAADSQRDVSIDDFTRVFAQGGVIDDFFNKTLAPFVDTSATPWRYRTLPGATAPIQGPDLEPFQHAREIRDVFFAAAGQRQLTWKATLRIPELDPTVTALTIDIDGQTTLYQHGPVTPFVVNWPGPRGGVHAEITANPRIRPDTSTLAADGPWALMRLLQKGHVVQTATPGRTRVAFDFEGRQAVLDISSAGSVANPLTSDVLQSFKCPSSMPMFNLVDTGPPPGLPPGLPSGSQSDVAVSSTAH